MPKGKGYAGEVGKYIKGAIDDGTITQKQADKLPEHLVTAIIKKKRGHAGTKAGPKVNKKVKPSGEVRKGKRRKKGANKKGKK